MRLRITSVDKYGLNGRELHPQESDIGSTGTVVNVFIDPDLTDDEMTAPYGPEPLVLFTIYRKGTNDYLEVAEYEVEVVGSESEGRINQLEEEVKRLNGSLERYLEMYRNQEKYIAEQAEILREYQEADDDRQHGLEPSGAHWQE